MSAHSRLQRFIWSVRRELWENRYLYIVPLAVAMLSLAAYVIGTLHLAEIMMIHPKVDGSNVMPPQGLPYSIAAVSVMVTGIITSIFYCLGALYNDRRDRSILFWKSLPVSDIATVLSKASIPLVVLPAIIFVVTLSMQLIMLAVSAIYAVTHAGLAPEFWVQWPFFRMGLVLVYGLATLALWYAPIYGWLLMVSAWARRAPFLWAILPLAGLCIAEKIAFDSTNLCSLLGNRVAGSFEAAFNGFGDNSGMPMQLDQLAPLKFLATPALWTGLAAAIVFLAVATRLRRYRGPL